MSKYCPAYGRVVLYLDCLECDDKICRKERPMYNKIVIGIDQSYADTGVSICVDGTLKNLSHIDYPSNATNSLKRQIITSKLDALIGRMKPKAKQLVVIIERIRLKSDGFINIDYIKSIGALNATIVDVATRHDIEVYSVDTRAWKSQIVGTSKPLSNKYGFDPKKWPTIKYIIKQGFEDYIKFPVSKQKKKAVIERDGERFTYNDNIADSACIALYGFRGNPEQLKREM